MSHLNIGDHWFIGPFGLVPHNAGLLVRFVGAMVVLIFLAPTLHLTSAAQETTTPKDGESGPAQGQRELQPPASAVETPEQLLESAKLYARQQEENLKERRQWAEIERGNQEVERMLSEMKARSRESQIAHEAASRAKWEGFFTGSTAILVAGLVMAWQYHKRVRAAQAQAQQLKVYLRRSEARIELLETQIRELAKRAASAEPGTDQLKTLICELAEGL